MKFKRHFYLVLFVLSCIIFGPIMIIGAYNLAMLVVGTFIFLNFGETGRKGILDYLVVGPWGPAGSFLFMIYFFKNFLINSIIVYVFFYIMSTLKSFYNNSKLSSDKPKGN